MTETAESLLAHYASRGRKAPEPLVSALLRTRSVAGREVLAVLAGAGEGATRLEELAREYLHEGGNSSRLRAFARSLNSKDAARYAYVAAVQRGEDRDEEAARGLFKAVGDVHGVQSFNRRSAGVFLQLALKARDFVTAEKLLAEAPLQREVRDLSTLDLMNPLVRPGRNEEMWLSELNVRFYGDRFVQLALQPEGSSIFDRLTGGPSQSIMHPGRITVIMSCFNPGREILTAARSVLAQTWRNVELLVIDDASTTASPGVLREVEDLDERVRVIRKDVNGGTYRARNTALRFATGDFFTCVDSDDWVHPQLFEAGIQPLLRDSALVATRGFGMRVTPDLELNRVGQRANQVAAQTLMARTFPALNRIGFFDTVRKAADTEYTRRLEAAFGGSVVNLPDVPLTFLRADERSLSAADLSRGWRHAARANYRDAYEHFHDEVRAGRKSAFVPLHGPRRFPAPRRWERRPQDGPAPAALDVCVVADWRECCVRPETIAYLERAVARGLRVGVVHLEGLHVLPRRRVAYVRRVRALLADGVVEAVSLDDDRFVRNVLVADPRPLQFPGETIVHLKLERLNVVLDPSAEAASEYCSVTVGENLTTMFGVKPEWGVPRLLAPDMPKPAPLPIKSLITLLPDGSCSAEDAKVQAWPVREPADGERGARLTAVGPTETKVEVDGIGALMAAWYLGPAKWADAAARWLTAHPTTWCLVVRSGSAVHVVSNDGVDVSMTESLAGAVGHFVLEHGDVGPQLTSSGIGGVERSLIDIERRQ